MQPDVVAQTSLIPASAAPPTTSAPRAAWQRPFTSATAKVAVTAKMADDAQWRRLRQLQLIDLKTKGWTHEQMAEHFGVGLKTIKRDFVTIRKEGLIDKYESRIVSQLVPEAVRVFAEEMQDPTSKHRVRAASKVFDMLAKLGDRKEDRDKAAAANGSAEETLDSWYQQWQQQPSPLQPPENTIDTELATTVALSATAATAPNNHSSAGETGPDPGGPAGHGAFSGSGSTHIASPTRPGTSEAGPGVDPPVETASSAEHSHCGRAEGA